MYGFMLNFLLFQAESAIAALNCSGAILGSLPIRLLFDSVELPLKLPLIFAEILILSFILWPMQGKPIQDSCASPFSSLSSALNNHFGIAFQLVLLLISISKYIYI